MLFSEVKKASNVQEEMERLRKQLKQEQLLKEQAVHKLAEIMNRKDINTTTKAKSKVSSADLRRKEKECRKLQQELSLVSIALEHFHEQIAISYQTKTLRTMSKLFLFLVAFWNISSNAIEPIKVSISLHSS